jgi:cell division protein FtsB
MKKRFLIKEKTGLKAKIKIGKKQVVWLLLFIFVSFQVFLTVQTSSSGALLIELEQKQIEFEDENKKLNEELVKHTSLSTTEEKAEELGFVKPQETVFIADEESVSLLH